MPTQEASRETFATPVEEHQEGIWEVEVSQVEEIHRLVFSKPLPMQLIQRYIRAALNHATVVQHEDGEWFAEVPQLAGVWAKQPSARQALDELEEVVFEWVLLKIRDEDRDIPVIDNFDLNLL